MINPQPGVPLERCRLIVPERIMTAGGLQGAQGIRQPHPFQPAESRPRLGAHQRVIRGKGARSQIFVRRTDIEVPDERKGLFRIQQNPRPGGQRIEEGELGRVTVFAAGIAIGQIEIADRDAVEFRLDIAGRRVIESGQGVMRDGKGRRPIRATPL